MYKSKPYFEDNLALYSVKYQFTQPIKLYVEDSKTMNLILTGYGIGDIITVMDYSLE